MPACDIPMVWLAVRHTLLLSGTVLLGPFEDFSKSKKCTKAVQCKHSYEIWKVEKYEHKGRRQTALPSDVCVSAPLVWMSQCDAYKREKKSFFLFCKAQPEPPCLPASL